MFPEARAIVAAAPAVAAAVNVAGLPFKPIDVAATIYAPITFPSFNTVDACPELLVVAVAMLNDCPDAPDGALAIAKLTLTPDTAFPPASVTVTTNGVGRVALIGAD